MKEFIRNKLWNILGRKYYIFLKNQNVVFLNEYKNVSIGINSYNNGAKVWSWGKKSSLKLGKYCSIANDVNFILDSGFHDFFKITNYPIVQNLFDEKEVINFNGNFETKKSIRENYPKSQKTIEIGNDVWIGANVTILPGVKIGNCCTILAGAVVTKSFEDFSIIGGIPAVKIGEKLAKEYQEDFLKIAWWNWDVDDIKNRVEDFNLGYSEFISKYKVCT